MAVSAKTVRAQLKKLSPRFSEVSLETLRKGRSLFMEADIFAQAACLLQILLVFGRVSGGCDLRTVGGAGKAASTVNFSASLRNWKTYYSDVRIIDQSASGLYESRSDNLLKLL